MSFRNGDDSWTEPVNLNDFLAFNRPSRFSCLTPDGKSIIFLCEDGFYWVSAEILKEARR